MVSITISHRAALNKGPAKIRSPNMDTMNGTIIGLLDRWRWRVAYPYDDVRSLKAHEIHNDLIAVAVATATQKTAKTPRPLFTDTTAFFTPRYGIIRFRSCK